MRKAIIRINEIKVLRVHTSYIGIYINNVRVRREKWLLETTHRDKIVRKINFYLRKGWYQSIYMSVLVKFINPFPLSVFFFEIHNIHVPVYCTSVHEKILVWLLWCLIHIFFFIDIDILLICLDRKFRSHGHVLKSDNTNSTDYDLQLSTMRHLQALVSFANYK